MRLATCLPGNSPCMSLALRLVGPPITIPLSSITYLTGCWVVPLLVVTRSWCPMRVRLDGSQQSSSLFCCSASAPGEAEVLLASPFKQPRLPPRPINAASLGHVFPDSGAGAPLQFSPKSLPWCAGEAQLSWTHQVRFSPVPLLWCAVDHPKLNMICSHQSELLAWAQTL